MRSPTKNLDASHLTDKEKRHSVSLILVGSLTLSLGLVLAFNNLLLVAALLWATGTGIIGFVWGYIGAMEDERSNGS